MAKVRCEVCGKKYYMINPEYGCPYCNNEETTNSSNSVSTVLKGVAGIAIFLGFAGGVIIGNEVDSIVYAFIIWGLCGIFAVFCFALAEIIQILHDIREKIEK